MAKVTIVFEDIEDGVDVTVESNPPFPGPAATIEEQNKLTDAQHMGLRFTHLVTQELASFDHECNDSCNHD